MLPPSRYNLRPQKLISSEISPSSDSYVDPSTNPTTITLTTTTRNHNSIKLAIMDTVSNKGPIVTCMSNSIKLNLLFYF